MARIFLIDDDLASELVVENLRQRGHDVDRVASVDEGLANIRRIVESDLVILDLIMPRSQDAPSDSVDGARSTGMAIFRALRQLRHDLPILVFTANEDPGPLDVIKNDRFARYISRWAAPKLQEFVAIVHQMLGVALESPSMQTFIVHGHDEQSKFEVKNYLQNTLGFPEPIILHEEPNLGRTLIEKFEDLATNADVAFVILTPDDRSANSSEGDVEKRRARQNVILELGFFLGMLGRRSGRVFLLHKGPLELPSDLSGVVYVDISHGIQSASDLIRREISAIR